MRTPSGSAVILARHPGTVNVRVVVRRPRVMHRVKEVQPCSQLQRSSQPRAGLNPMIIGL